MTLIYLIAAFLAGIFFQKIMDSLAIIFGLKNRLLHWKKEVMQKFVDSYPNVYKEMLQVETWEDAMKQLSAYKEFPEEAARDESST